MPIRIDEIITKGASSLEKKFMGGVTQESATRAISETAHEVQRQMDEVSRLGIDEVKSQNEKAMATLKEAHLRELALKDRENLVLKQSNNAVTQEKNSLEIKLKKLMAKIQDGLNFKEIESKPDGSRVFEKHSLNGVRALKTVNSNDVTTQMNIELADKTFRRTSYNPLTKQPTRTVTNATKTGETVEILYDDYGHGGKPKVLNQKKSKENIKPTLVDRKTNKISESTIEVDNLYSDGSKIKSEVDRRTNEVRNWTKWKNANSSWWDEWYAKDERGVSTAKRVWNENKSRIEYEQRVNISPNGIRMVSPYSRLKDEFTGVVTSVDRMTFPKSSPIKRIETFKPENSDSIIKSVVKMKNGTVYEMTDYKKVPSNRELRPGGGLDVLAPQKVVKISKDGAKAEMNQEEIMPWLESFHPGYNFSLMSAKQV